MTPILLFLVMQVLYTIGNKRGVILSYKISRGVIMDKSILEQLTELSEELKSLKLDIMEFKTEMHNQFDKVEAKLDGVSGQFKLTNKSKVEEFDINAD